MSNVTIYRFKMYSPREDEFILSKRWGTIEAIKKIGGVAIEGTAVEADQSVIATPLPEIAGLTEKGFDPRPREHGGDGG